MLNDMWFKLTLILAVAIGSNFLFSKFGQPKIIGQILIGIIIGPSLLGLIVPLDQVPGADSTNILARLTEVGTLATLGAIVLLFMIGLECNMKEIYTKRSVVVASFGVVVPWVCGFLLAEWLLPDPDVGTKFAQSVIIGASLVATSVAITAGVMKEMGIIGSKPAKLILGAAVVDDILGMIVLAVSYELASGIGIQILNVAWIVVAAIAFVAAGAFVGSRYISKLIDAVDRKGNLSGMPGSGFVTALTFAFLYAFIAELIGISAIVGAFVAGTSFASCKHGAKFRMNAELLSWVLAPIFFISLGILVNIWLPWEIWAFALILTIFAALTKLAGCGIPAKLLGFTNMEAVAVGTGMIPRMEIAMIIALYAFGKGIITRDVYSIIVLMGLLTALFTPPLLKIAMRNVPKVADECAVAESLSPQEG